MEVFSIEKGLIALTQKISYKFIPKILFGELGDRIHFMNVTKEPSQWTCPITNAILCHNPRNRARNTNFSKYRPKRTILLKVFFSLRQLRLSHVFALDLCVILILPERSSLPKRKLPPVSSEKETSYLIRRESFYIPFLA